jgi:hypothetical protein
MTSRSVFYFSPLMAALVVALASCGPSSFTGGVAGSGNPATESRQVGSFSKVEIEGSADVEVAVNPVASLTVTTDDNLLPLVKTEVTGDTLKIGWAKGASTRLGIKVRIATPSLEALSISGSGTIHAEGIKGDAFSISISGSGTITAKGQADRCDLAINGSGDIQTGELVAHDARVAIDGSGSVTVYADRSLEAAIAGTGSISYLGHPAQVKKSIMGIGSIQPR